jgi:protein tyrosine/serine phosphatase
LQPIFVHCAHGQDRTGLVIGLERVLIEQQAPQAAHDEMVKIGFHTMFIGLESYFERKTNWQP